MKMNPKQREEVLSATITYSLLLVAGISLASIATASAVNPSWWSSPGTGSQPAVMTPQVVTNATTGIVSTNYITNDYALVNQGQLKQFTARAVDEMNANAALSNAGGGGSALNYYVHQWHQDYLTNSYYTNTTNPSRPYKPSDLDVVNVGQLKYIARLVWGQLTNAGYTTQLPSWLGQTNLADLSAANIGQLKTVFNFDPNAAPQPVTGVMATTSAPNEIDLSWTIPANDPITSITVVQTNPDGSTTTYTLPPNSTSFAATGLDSGGNYSFNISASNQVSSSPSSSASPASTPPPKPTPRYAVIDLGPSIFPMALSNTGYILLYCNPGDINNSRGHFYRWYQGNAQQLNDATTLFTADIWLPGTIPNPPYFPNSQPWISSISDAGVVPANIDPSQLNTSFSGNAQVLFPGSSTNPVALPAVSFAPGGYSTDYRQEVADCIDYNGTTYGNDYEFGSFNDGSGFALAQGLSWANVGASAQPLKPVIVEDYSTPLNDFAYLLVLKAKNNHTLGLLNGPGIYATNFPSAVDGQIVASSFVATSINTDGAAIGYERNPNYGSYFIYQNSKLQPLVIQGSASNVGFPDNPLLDMNHATAVKHNSDGSTSAVVAPQLLGSYYLAQMNPDNNIYESSALTDLISQPPAWSAFSANQINDNGAIVGTATYYAGPDPSIADGSHGIVLAPAYEVQVDAFIPQEFVPWPGNSFVGVFGEYFYGGDKRKTPLDGMFPSGSGTAIFNKNGSYRLRQKVMATALKEYDPDGSQEKEENLNQSDWTPASITGETTAYTYSEFTGDPNTSSGHLTPSSTPYAFAHATPNWATTTVTHPSSRAVKIEMDCQCGDPLALGAWAFGPISYDITVTIDATDPAHPTYTLTGNHKLFPAYEVYINGQLVHDYSPIPGSNTPNALLLSTYPLSDSNVTTGTSKPLTGAITP